MTLLGKRLKRLREELKLSQVAVGAQGFVSAPGWIKIENGQRTASEKLIGNLRGWLVRDRYVSAAVGDALHAELLLLKYLDDPSAFVRQAVQTWAQTTERGRLILQEVQTSAPPAKPKRGRPRHGKKGDAR